MMVVEPADASETRQAVWALAEHKGPVYMRLKRGEIPLIFDDAHRLDLHRAQMLSSGELSDVCIIAAGMMIPAALAAAATLEDNGLSATVINAPVIKPLDATTLLSAMRRSRIVVTAENHSVIGGLGSAVAEAMSEAGIGLPLRRIGILDVFAESGSREFLFPRYGLDTQSIVRAVWSGLGITRPEPLAPVQQSAPGTYAPV
jgi:transketolase